MLFPDTCAFIATVIVLMAFIHYILEPRGIAGISETVGYANHSPASNAPMSATITGNPGIYPPPSIMAKLYAPKNNHGRSWA